MGQMGRPRKPTALRLLEGNPGRRPLPSNEPHPAEGNPARPAMLRPEARREWARLVKSMPPGLLTKADRIAMTIVCEAWADWVEAMADLNEHGWYYVTDKGFEGQRPAAARMRQAQALIITMSGKLGLSPSDRARMSMPEKSEKSLEELLA